MIHQHAILEDTVYFWFAANDTAGSGNDGATPVYDVRLAGAAADAAPVLSGNATLLSHANYPAGAHEVAIAATTANGFAAGSTYGVFCTLLVDSQNPTGFIGSFTLGPVVADVMAILGTALTETAGGYLAAAFKKLFDVETPTGTINSLPAAIPGAAGGLFIAGTNAPVTISGSGNALTLTSTGANGHGLAATGNGNGNGITATGGATGDGAAMEGGATNGFGLNVAGNGDHAGVRVAGEGTGAGLQVSGGTTGNGITISGGLSSGSGVYITTPGAGPYGLAVFGGSNGSAILAAGQGAGHGLSVAGGATGHGLSALGGSTSGDGMHLEGRTLGHGLYAIGVGASRYDIDADIHGTIDTCTTNTDMRGTDGAALPGDKMDLLDTIVEDAP